MAINQDIYCTEYTEFDDRNGSFDWDEFIRKGKDIRNYSSHFWHQKYSLPCTKVIGFVVCRVTSMVLVIGKSHLHWGDVNTIKYGKISSFSSDVSEKQSIVYTSAYIESDRNEKYHSENCSSHTWNEDDDAFDQQLEKWGMEKLFSDQSKPVTRELRAYI